MAGMCKEMVFNVTTVMAEQSSLLCGGKWNFGHKIKLDWFLVQGENGLNLGEV